MIGRPIDVWDLDTFDTILLDELRDYAGVICDYVNAELRNFMKRENSDHRGIYPQNPHSGDYSWVIEHIINYMESRTIRA
jgi:hypothetical protein